MKTCKIKYTIFAIAFVVACLLPFYLSDNYCCKEGVSFDQNILSIIAILTAIIVSIHVVDYFRIKDIEDKQKLLEDEQKEVRVLHTKTENYLWLIKGFSLVELEPFLAFWCFCEAFEKGLQNNDAILCKKSLKNMQQVIKHLRKKTIKSKKINKHGWDKLEKFKKNKINTFSNFELYELFEKNFSIKFRAIEKIRNL